MCTQRTKDTIARIEANAFALAEEYAEQWRLATAAHADTSDYDRLNTLAHRQINAAVSRYAAVHMEYKRWAAQKKAI
jgi:hypothetical protein